MKKILVLGALAGLGYYFMNKNKTADTSTTPTTTTPPATDPGYVANTTTPTPAELFANYNGKVIVEAKGYWTIVENNKIRSATQADLDTGKYTVVNVPFDFWEVYVGTYASYIA